MKQRRWQGPPDPRPKHPYRDSALVFGGMAIVIVVVAGVTGGDLRNAILIAAGFFVVTTAWSWRRYRRELRERETREAGGPAASASEEGAAR